MPAHDFVNEHSTTLGNHEARIGSLESWVSGIDKTLEETSRLTNATAQSVHALTRFGWILAGIATSAMLTAIVNLVFRLAVK